MRKRANLIIVAMVRDDIDCFYDVGMLESGADTEFCGDFFLILLFAFAWAAWTKLLYGINVATVLALYETNRATSAAAQHLAPLSVLFREMSLGCVVERCDWRKGLVGRDWGGGCSVLALLYGLWGAENGRAVLELVLVAVCGEWRRGGLWG